MSYASWGQSGRKQISSGHEELASPAMGATSGLSCEEIMPGLNLIIMSLDSSEDWKIDFVKPDNVFEFGFVLSGVARASVFRGANADAFEVNPGSVVAHHIPNIEGRFEAKGNQKVRMLGMEIELSLLRQMLEEQQYHAPELKRLLSAQGGEHFKCHSGMNILQKVAAVQIFECPFSGAARTLFIQGKVLEVLAYQLDQLSGEQRAGRSTTLAPEDVDRIREARAILKRNMASPPSLTTLASEVGVNTNKLKKGFKAVFGQTAFGCLHADRMHRAQELLQERNLNVSEVAWDVGYTNVGHFSVAFRKFFGVRPKDFRAETGKRFHPGL